MLLDAAWQRRTHYLRNLLTKAPKSAQPLVATLVRSIFAQPDRAAVAEQLDSIADKLGRQFPAVEQMLREAEADICAFACFPVDHWPRIWSTNPLERLIKEIKRRSDVVGIFPDERAILRLTGAVLIEAHNEWAIAEWRYLSEGSMASILAAGEPSGLASTPSALLAS